MEKEIEYLKKYYKGDIKDAIKRLQNNEPVQYIVGDVDFYGYTLDVDKNVLIPRRETEELVEYVIKYAKRLNKPSIIDVGTGTGAIAIALSKELNLPVYASDISPKAIEVARKNVEKTDSKVSLLLGDMLKPYIDKNIKVDILVSNPPYIREDEKIEKIVKDNEPEIALYAPNNGLFYYEEILKKYGNLFVSVVYFISNCFKFIRSIRKRSTLWQKSTTRTTATSACSRTRPWPSSAMAPQAPPLPWT